MMMILLQLLWMPKHPWVVYRYIIKHLHRHTTQDKQYRVSPPGSRSPVLQVEVLETDLNLLRCFLQISSRDFEVKKMSTGMV